MHSRTSFSVLIFILLIWEILVNLLHIPKFILPAPSLITVSYTHLDVYKRQITTHRPGKRKGHRLYTSRSRQIALPRPSR